MAALKTSLREGGSCRTPRKVRRRANSYSSVFPSEIVICRLDCGVELPLLCKYGVDHDHTGHGYWHGPEYEASVYRNVLADLPISAPRLHGTFRDPASDQTWLFLEYLQNSVRLDQVPFDDIRLAAQWLGQFHRINESRVDDPALSFLNRFDADYFLGWARRTSAFAGDLHCQYPWLRTLCQRFEALVDALVASPPTIVHGEFCLNNILLRDSAIYPIDWQSAAVGPGEIDLASLTDGWQSDDDVRRCLRLYAAGRRYGTSQPRSDAIGAARLYWAFRWLGDHPFWTHHPSRQWRFAQLRNEGELWGLI
jgi:aminoglycoside phosphotransferase (APT) family kinase protein